MKVMHDFKQAGGDKESLSFLHPTKNQDLSDMMWLEDDCDDVDIEFGQRIDNRGRRVYHLMADL